MYACMVSVTFTYLIPINALNQAFKTYTIHVLDLRMYIIVPIIPQPGYQNEPYPPVLYS